MLCRDFFHVFSSPPLQPLPGNLPPLTSMSSTSMAGEVRRKARNTRAWCASSRPLEIGPNASGKRFERALPQKEGRAVARRTRHRFDRPGN